MAEDDKIFPKQEGAFLNTKKLLKSSTTKGVRYWKNVGFGYKTPQEAITGTYIDHKDPFTSDVSIRGRIVKGLVISTKMTNTIVIRRDFLHFRPKYKRYEKRHTNIPVHCAPCFKVKVGDIVTAGQCRPLCKTVRFNVLKVEPHESNVSVKKQFMLF
jgi:small subunit ribosomal protein S11e